MNIEVMADEFNETDTQFETVKRFTIKDLLNEMSDLEREFVCISNAAFSSIERIYHNPKFLLWRSKVIDLLSSNTDYLAQKIVKELERFDGWSDRTLFNNIKAELTVLADNQQNEDVKIMVNHDTSINENSKPIKFWFHMHIRIRSICQLLLKCLKELVCQMIHSFALQYLDMAYLEEKIFLTG